MVFDEVIVLNKYLLEVYVMPDGQELKIGQERFKCTEALFHPSMMGKQCPGMHHQIYTSIMKTDIDVRRQLYENIVLSGGSSMFSGTDNNLLRQNIKPIMQNMDFVIISN